MRSHASTNDQLPTNARDPMDGRNCDGVTCTHTDRLVAGGKAARLSPRTQSGPQWVVLLPKTEHQKVRARGAG